MFKSEECVPFVCFFSFFFYLFLRLVNFQQDPGFYCNYSVDVISSLVKTSNWRTTKNLAIFSPSCMCV